MPRRYDESPRSRTEVAAETAAFAAHCRTHGLSVTHQRLALFEALAGSRIHPSAEQLHRMVRRRIPTLSLATVYKNLEALRAIGAVSDVNILHEQGRFEAALPGTGAGKPHHHLVCIACRKVSDLPAECLPALHVEQRDAQGFEVRAVRVQVEGLCASCAGRREAPTGLPARTAKRRSVPARSPRADASRHRVAARSSPGA
jgi:Fur family transcriptional regulator, peroxide stress response regulator